MAVFKVKSKPEEVEVIQWTNNEAEIRDFIRDDGAQKYRPDNVLQIYDKPTLTWMNCPMFYFIVKHSNGNLSIISPEDYDRNYETA